MSTLFKMSNCWKSHAAAQLDYSDLLCPVLFETLTHSVTCNMVHFHALSDSGWIAFNGLI